MANSLKMIWTSCGNNDSPGLTSAHPLSLSISDNIPRKYTDNNPGVEMIRQIKKTALALAMVGLLASGGAMAGFDEGQAAYQKGDYATALKEFRPLAMQGDARGQLAIGVLHQHGRGVAKNEAEAVNWYRKAAEQGLAVAQNLLGFMYENGTGVVKNETEAANLFRKAAEQGDAYAQYNLGNMYKNGRGVANNDAEAVKWFRKAAEQGYADAQYNLGLMYDYSRGVNININHVLVYALYNVAAAGGNQKGAAKRDEISKLMKQQEINAAQNLSQELAKPGAIS